MNQHKVFLSNQVEQLFVHFKEELFATSSPFARRLVIVPSPAIKSWLMMQCAASTDLSIAAGLEIRTLPQAFDTLQRQFAPTDAGLNNPSSLEMAFAIETEIKKMVKEEETHPHPWKSLLDYLKISETSFSRKSERRLVMLSEELAHLFGKYGNYAENMTQHWMQSPKDSEWQQYLWRKIFEGQYPWDYPIRQLQRLNLSTLTPQKDKWHIHLFAVSFLSHVQNHFLNQLSEKIPVNYYMISPCRAFWVDVFSDRETQKLRSSWKKQKVAETKQLALEEFLRDRNPLLANFGRLGREMASQIEKCQSESTEDYILPSAVACSEFYTDFVDGDISLYESERSFSLLEATQADMLLLRNPDNQPKVEIDQPDQSIQVHIAPSIQREVEILYNNLLGMITDKENDPLSLSDIIVMVPDIRRYESAIKSVFGHQESKLDFQLMDLKIQSESSLVQGFLFLINLCFSRWEASLIVQLLEYPEFQRKQRLNAEDVQQLRYWIKETGVRWGHDAMHRNELLKRDHCIDEMADDSSVGSWEFSLSRLLMGLTMVIDPQDENIHDLDVLPFSGLDMTQGELLGKLIKILQSIKDDLKPLTNGTELPLEDWVNYLHCLCNSYFAIDRNDENALETKEALYKQIETLRQAAKYLPEAKFQFLSIKNRLESLLQQETLCYRENHLQSIRFCSLLPMRAIPAKVICLMGMQEDAFPKNEVSTSLNLMWGKNSSDYCPTPLDYDRYLFLEVLLSARRQLVISYSIQQSSKQLKSTPSLVVAELLSYLDKSYTIQGKKVSDVCITEHPFYPFDARYFSGNPHLRSFSSFYFRAAQSFYLEEKREPHLFCQELFEEHPLPTRSSALPVLTLNIKSLGDIAYNPLKTYFNQTLGIYLKSDEEGNQDEETFVLTNRKNASLRKESLNKPFEQILSLANKEGILPRGVFKDVASDRLKEEVIQIKDNLKKMGVQDHQIIEIELDEHCQKPTQKNERYWIVPAIEIKVDEKLSVKLVGKLPHVSSEGLIVHGKNEAQDIIKAWPHYLLLHHLNPFPIKKQILLTKSDKPRSVEISFDEAQENLRAFILYYFSCLDTMSVLIPELIPDILNRQNDSIKSKIFQYMHDPHTPVYNDYLRWSCLHDVLSRELRKEKWHFQADALYGRALRALFPKKVREE